MAMAAYEQANGAIYQVFTVIILIILQKLDTLSFDNVRKEVR